MMKIAAVSMRIKQGRCEENVRQMMRCIEEAKQEGAQLIVFPQNAVSGLQLGEMWLDDDFCRYADSFNARIAALADTIIRPKAAPSMECLKVNYTSGCARALSQS